MPHDDNERQTFLGGAPAGYNPNQSHGPSVQVHGGGAVRIQHLGAAARQEVMQAPPHESTRVHTGPIRMTMGPNGTVTDVGVARHTHTDSGTAGGTVMSTLRTGSTPSVCRVPGDESTRISLASAERDFGLVVRDASGRYVDKASSAALALTPSQRARHASDELAALNAKQQAADSPAAEDTGNLEAADAQSLNEAIADIPQQVFEATLNRGVGLVLGTHTAEQIANDLARDGLVPEDEAHALVENVAPLYQKRADAILARQGLEGDDLRTAYAWMRDSRPQATAHVVRQFLLTGDSAPLKKLAGEWQAQSMRRAANGSNL